MWTCPETHHAREGQWRFTAVWTRRAHKRHLRGVMEHDWAENWAAGTWDYRGAGELISTGEAATNAAAEAALLERKAEEERSRAGTAVRRRAESAMSSRHSDAWHHAENAQRPVAWRDLADDAAFCDEPGVEECRGSQGQTVAAAARGEGPLGLIAGTLTFSVGRNARQARGAATGSRPRKRLPVMAGDAKQSRESQQMQREKQQNATHTMEYL